MMRRREFITLLGGAATWPLATRAEGPSGRPLIAILNLNSGSSVSPRLRGFLQAMHDLGYVEGRDFDLAERYADGQLERLPVIANELVRLNPNLFVTGSMPAAFAAKQASKTIAIVGVGLVDPVGLGLAASEARPGGQVTGTLISIDGLPGKQLALATEILPNANRFGLLVNPGNQGHAVLRREAETAAASLALSLIPVEASSPTDLDRAFQALARERVELVMVLNDPVFNRENRRIAVLAAAKRLPTMYSLREYVEAGGMMSYGVSLSANWRRAAYYVDRILRGSRPEDLPIELPTKLELVINLGTAKAIELPISEQFLLRADEVIE
jgi:putative tryptophan/tyrosine transport system substrate-binding protein